METFSIPNVSNPDFFRKIYKMLIINNKKGNIFCL
jgi:hypothetical protein